MVSEINSGSVLINYATKARESQANEVTDTKDTFSNLVKGEGSHFPYSSLAKDGIIEYNGVVFVGDSKSNSINLGDMSNKNRVMHIQLSGGGLLNVNYDNIGDLKEAMGMFSGKDQGIILKAIATHHFEQGFVKAADDEEEETVEKMGQQSISEEKNELSEDIEMESDVEIAMELMKQSGSSMYDKLMNIHEDTIQVGPSIMTVQKWD